VTVDDLTRREREVLRLVADGLSDREVAARLGISAGTVGEHLRSIYRKLGVGRRIDAVRSVGLLVPHG